MGIRAACLLVVLGACVAEPDYGSVEQDLNVDDFVLPTLDDAERAVVVHKYDALDPDNQIPRGLLEDAIEFYDFNLAVIPNQKYVAIGDFSKFSGKTRFWIVNMETGAVEGHKVAHGSGSDPNGDGIATKFSNVNNSHMTSLGFYLGGAIFNGSHPHSMWLDGLTADGSPNGMGNTRARTRLVVMHEATYVKDSRTSAQGRSNGCLALDPSIERSVVDKLHDGGLIYTATKPLHPPVGRTDAPVDSPADDPYSNGDIDEDAVAADEEAEEGGCSTGGAGTSAITILGALALLPRRRRR